MSWLLAWLAVQTDVVRSLSLQTLPKAAREAFIRLPADSVYCSVTLSCCMARFHTTRAVHLGSASACQPVLHCARRRAIKCGHFIAGSCPDSKARFVGISRPHMSETAGTHIRLALAGCFLLGGGSRKDADGNEIDSSKDQVRLACVVCGTGEEALYLVGGAFPRQGCLGLLSLLHRHLVAGVPSPSTLCLSNRALSPSRP